MEGDGESGSQECCVCYEALKTQGKIDCCPHEFCWTCIRKWSKLNTQCPMCKRDFKYITKIQKKAKGDPKVLERIKVKKRRGPNDSESSSSESDPSDGEYRPAATDSVEPRGPRASRPNITRRRQPLATTTVQTRRNARTETTGAHRSGLHEAASQRLGGAGEQTVITRFFPVETAADRSSPEWYENNMARVEALTDFLATTTIDEDEDEDGDNSESGGESGSLSSDDEQILPLSQRLALANRNGATRGRRVPLAVNTRRDPIQEMLNEALPARSPPVRYSSVTRAPQRNHNVIVIDDTDEEELSVDDDHATNTSESSVDESDIPLSERIERRRQQMLQV